MPCACKKRKQQQPIQVYRPSVSTFVPVTVPQTSVQNTMLDEKVSDSAPHGPSPASAYLAGITDDAASGYSFILDSDSAAYDFTATTKAQQTCTFCAAKHIAFASVLVQSGQGYDVCIAAGQLMLAASHYKQQYSSLSSYCSRLAHYIVYSIRDTSKVQQYLESLLSFISGTETQLKPLPVYRVQQHQSPLPPDLQYIRPVLYISAAFSLLYTQVDYLKLNKQYAVGYLVKAATIAANGMFVSRHSDLHKYLISKLRQAWKLVQQIEQDSKQYYLCRQRLLVLLHNYIGLYITYSNQVQHGRPAHTAGLHGVHQWLDKSDAQLHSDFMFSVYYRRNPQHIRQASDSAAS